MIEIPMNKFLGLVPSIEDCDGCLFFRRKNNMYVIKFHTEDSDHMYKIMNEVGHKIFDAFLKNL